MHIGKFVWIFSALDIDCVRGNVFSDKAVGYVHSLGVDQRQFFVPQCVEHKVDK